MVMRKMYILLISILIISGVVFLCIFYMFVVADIPAEWPKRAILYAKQMHESSVLPTNHNPPVRLDAVNHTIFGKSNFSAAMPAVKQLDDNEKIYPSKLGNFIYKPASAPVTKLVCYYFAADKPASLRPQDIHPNLCTHINIGIALIRDNRIVITDVMRRAFDEVNELKRQNKHLKVLVWVGGGGDQSGGFPEMVQNHANRKLFIQSLKDCLETHHIDGIDLDWEFPSAYQRERQHFTQLLHEIRREYQREHRTYLLSVAAAALEGIAYFSYDITELNNYVDYVNLMTYDYHFYTKETPFTGDLVCSCGISFCDFFCFRSKRTTVPETKRKIFSRNTEYKHVCKLLAYSGFG